MSSKKEYIRWKMRNKENMTSKFEREGHILKVNRFDTPRGIYHIKIIFMDGSPYYVKYKNGILMEAVNIDDLCGAERYILDIKQKQESIRKNYNHYNETQPYL